MANFKVSTRALDMLGKQQIAGIPTATSELFKNAYDAYADNVEVDYFRHKDLLVLRDNGYGMTFEDFQTKWLVVGTDSKYNKKIELNPFNKEERPIMGEKGIGRLAISTIGPQVLILTRAFRNNKPQNLVVSFINWEVFGLPGLSMEDIHISLYEIKGEDLPDVDYVCGLVEECEENLSNLNSDGKISNDDLDRILTQLNQFEVDLLELDSIFNDLKLSDNSCGTHFYIGPVDESLGVSLDTDYNTGDISRMQKMLIGFTNTMNAEQPKIIKTAFRDYKTENINEAKDIIKDTEFFTPEECEMADHHFDGVFDEYGQFQGNITVYNEKFFPDHEIPWAGANGKQTLCGPFSIKVNYLQGTIKDTALSSDDYKYLQAKCNRIGGLYIYRDGIRLLPFGDTDYDFLNFEKRRTKSASYYFFSHRRMIGAIEICHKENAKLIEKAGREGLIENKAYRQFKSILQNFFIQLANDFFRTGGGPKSEHWTKKKEEFDRADKVRKKREKLSTEKKTKFTKALESFFADKYLITEELYDVLERCRFELEGYKIIEDEDELARTILGAELKSLQEISNIEKKYKVLPPKGFHMNKELRRDWEAYLDDWSNITLDSFHLFKKKLSALIDTYNKKYQIELNKRLRLQQAIGEISQNVEKSLSTESQNTKKIVKAVGEQVVDLTRTVMIELGDSISRLKTDFAKLDVSKLNDDALFDQRIEIEDKITEEAEKHKEILESVQAQLNSIHWTKDEEGHIITQSDINDSLEEELEELRQQINMDVELSQLGLAVGVIHHEFTSTAQSIKDNIKNLRAHSDVNEKLHSLYKDLRANFEHLDGYLALFSPLDRRMYRKKEEIPYKVISTFILDIFKERFRRHSIDFKVTKGFNARKIFACRSKIYPVFVNIIDNAVYWLKQTESNIEKTIRIHADDNGFYISNNGPEIVQNIKRRIFELGYSKKETLSGRGRGMGLHITRDVLKNSGYDVYVAEPRNNSTVTFAIQKKINEEDTDE